MMMRPTSLAMRLLARVKGEMALALARTFIARAIAAVGSLFLVIALGRIYGPEGVGVYALAQSIILGISLLSRFGMDNALMRYVGQNPQSPHTVTYLKWALRKALFLSFVVSAIVFISRGVLDEVFGAEGLSGVLIGITLAAPAFTSGFLLSGFFKGVRKPATACLLENGSVALVAAAILCAWNWIFGQPEVAFIGWSYALAAWIVLLQGGIQLWAWYRNQTFCEACSDDNSVIERSQFNLSSQAFFVMSLAGFMQAVLGVMVAGWLLTSADLGLFKTSQQTAVLIGFILIVLNAVIPPRFASLYHQGNVKALGRLARRGAILGTVLASPLLLVCLLVPEWVLFLFGKEFEEAAPLLRVIALAQLVNVSTGSIGFLLNMTGHEALMRNIALICNAIGLLLFFLLIPLFGPLGAALALAFVLVFQNVVALFFVWKKLGIWTLPMPNVLHFFGVKVDKET